MPAGADIYLLKHVIHDWPDGSAKLILGNISAAMVPTSRLVIIEGVLDHDCEDSDTLITRNLEQMVWTDGKVRTMRKFEALTSGAGLRISGVTHTEIDDVSFIECRLPAEEVPYPQVAGQ